MVLKKKLAIQIDFCANSEIKLILCPQLQSKAYKLLVY